MGEIIPYATECDSDQASTPMPDHCILWGCNGARLEDRHGFQVCPTCGSSYGPASSAPEPSNNPAGTAERLFNLVAIWDAYEAGARDARAHHPASDHFGRSADAYCKMAWNSDASLPSGAPTEEESR